MYLKWGLLDLILRIINNKLVPSILMTTGAPLSGQRLGNFCWLGSINSPFSLYIKHLFGFEGRDREMGGRQAWSFAGWMVTRLTRARCRR